MSSIWMHRRGLVTSSRQIRCELHITNTKCVLVSNHTVRYDYVLYRLIITTAITIINNIITWYKIRTKDEFGEKVSDHIRE